MTTWREQMAELIATTRMRPLMEGLAAGGVVDEGEKATDWDGLHPLMGRRAEDRRPRVEWDADARLWLIENADQSIPPEWRAALQEVVRAARAANDHVSLQRIAASFQSPEWVPGAKAPVDVPEYVSSGDARDLAGSDFYTEVVAGAEQLEQEGWSRHDYPELEYMRRKAEDESGWNRAYKNEGGERSAQEAKFMLLYDRFERRYRYQAKSRRVSSKGQPKATRPPAV